MLGNISQLSAVRELTDPSYGQGVFTCFLPDDAAWLAHGTNNLSSASIQDVLAAHIIPGKVLYSTTGGKDVRTKYGNTITFNRNGGSSLFQNFNFVTSDIPLSAGVLHIIDQ